MCSRTLYSGCKADSLPLSGRDQFEIQEPFEKPRKQYTPPSSTSSPNDDLCLKSRAVWMFFAILLSLLLPRAAHAGGKVTVVGVATNYDSVKVRFLPVPGASDYRIYDANVPGTVKYAGIWHLLSPSGYLFQKDSTGKTLVPDALVVPLGSSTTPFEADVPGLELEMNGLMPGVHYSLVIEAVDALGPVAACCMYNGNNAAITGCPTGCPGCRLGMNSCCTKDGKTSTNGQGPAANKPNVIASTTVTVTPTGVAAIPTSPQATQVLFEPFSTGTITPTGMVDPNAGIKTYSLRTPAAAWEIRTELADTINTQVFVADNHFMGVLFDGGTPGTNNPLHQAHSVLALSPTQTVDYSAGKILHVTAEIDSHFGPDIRRYADFRFTPANDPYIAFDALIEKINNTDTDLEVQFQLSDINVSQSTGPLTPSSATSPPNLVGIVGAAGQALYTDGSRPRNFLGTNGYQNGRGLDNRDRFDLFVSTKHFSVYENGIKITEHDLAVPLPFEQAKVYFAQYHYHSALEVQELSQFYPWETYFINMFPSSDERHWDNMGYEVLPASTEWSTIGGLVQPPPFLPVVTSAATAAFVGTDKTTSGNWLGKYGKDGYSIVGDAIDFPAYSEVDFANNWSNGWYWATDSSTSNVSALQKVSIAGDRLGAAWYDGPSISVDVNLTDGIAHQIGLYCLDLYAGNWNALGGEIVQVLDADTGKVLDTESISDATGYAGGAYLVWNVTGHVQLLVTSPNPNGDASISGIFFDPLSAAAIPAPQSVGFSPASVTGGTSATGTVTLNIPAPAGGQVVALTSSAGVSVPANVTVPAGNTSVSFSATTIAVSASTKSTVQASANGTMVSTTLEVLAPLVSSLTLNPTTVIGGKTSSCTVKLTGPAPSGGQVVALSCSGSGTAPSSITVPAGATSATFTVTTGTVALTTTSTIKAAIGTSTKSTTLTIQAPVLLRTSFSPMSLKGGGTTVYTVTLNGPAPTGGILITLANSDPSVASAKSSVTIPAGATSASINVQTKPVKTTTNVKLTATFNGVSIANTVTLTP